MKESPLLFFSICAKNYLAQARVLANSLRNAYGPKCNFFLVLSDAFIADCPTEPFPIIPVNQLSLDDLEGLIFRYDVVEFNTAIKPACFEYFFAQGHQRVVYLDPDTYALSPFIELEQYFDEGIEAILTPHITEATEDDFFPNDSSMLLYGTYNLGFLALTKSPATLKALAWWHQKLQYDCRDDLPRGLFVDQKWVNLFPAFIEHTKSLRHAGYNLAYWNLIQRKVSKAPDGSWLANGEPLRLAHFSGLDFHDPSCYSRHQQKFNAYNIGVFSELLEKYRREVLANKELASDTSSYTFDFNRGRRIPRLLRVIYREQLERRGEIIDNHFERALEFANQQADGFSNETILTRFMLELWKSRSDLQCRFSLNDLAKRSEYADWFSNVYQTELGLDRVFLKPFFKTPVPTSSTTATNQSTTIGNYRPIRTHIKNIAFRFARHLPQKIQLSLKRWLKNYRAYRCQKNSSSLSTELTTISNQPKHSISIPSKEHLVNGLLLIGYPKAENGMGEHVRSAYQAFSSVGLSTKVMDFNDQVTARQNDTSLKTTTMADCKINLFCVNAPQMPIIEATLGQDLFKDRYNIGYWSWELSKCPKIAQQSFKYHNELWAPSEFIRATFASATDLPVIHMPLAVIKPPFQSKPREYFGLPPTGFIFLAAFDLSSYLERKNPFGMIEAFRRAFPNAIQDQVWLVLKFIGQEQRSGEIDRLKQASCQTQNIILINTWLSSDETWALMNCADAYFSLHRSEGFGRCLAEAMLLNKPVIATGYSGSNDFIRPDTALPIRYKLVSVPLTAYPDAEEQVWADPDLDDAAAALIKIYRDAKLRESLATAGCIFIKTHHNKEVVGTRYKKRLQEIKLLNNFN